MDGLERYQIMEPLGSGGQGTMYRGIDRLTNREVAIKVLQLGKLEGWKGFDLFERECDVLASLDHPGIPNFLDRYYSAESGDYFLVMDLVPGTSLQARLDDGERFSDTQLVELLRQTLEILRYLHSRRPPVIHRDLKPANLVLTHDGEIRLVDFGGVRVTVRGDAGGSTMVGTFGYMAPEQLHGQAKPATDLFALGATFATMATGVDAENLPRAGLKIDVAGMGLTDGPLGRALERMLEPDPDERTKNVDEVLAALDDVPARTAGSKTRSRRPPPSSSDPALQALAKVDDGVKELATVESPLFRIVVWVFAAMMTGGLIVLESVMLPIIFSIFGTMARRHGTERELKDQRTATIASVREGRRNMQYLADRTSPFGSRGATARQVRRVAKRRDRSEP